MLKYGLRYTMQTQNMISLIFPAKNIEGPLQHFLVEVLLVFQMINFILQWKQSSGLSHETDFFSSELFNQ